MIDKIRKNKKYSDLKAITGYILKTEASNLGQDFIETMISELTNRNLIENRMTPQGLDSFRRILSISLEQKEVLHSHVHEKCSYISRQSMGIDSVSNETISKIATDLRTPEINEKKQTKT